MKPAYDYKKETRSVPGYRKAKAELLSPGSWVITIRGGSHVIASGKTEDQAWYNASMFVNASKTDPV